MASWKIAVVRRASGRLLRAHRNGVVDMGPKGETACVEAITRGFMHPSIRNDVMTMWGRHGADIVGSCTENAIRRHQLDDHLDAIVTDKVG